MKTYPFDQDVIWHVIFHPGKTLWSRSYRHVSLAGFTNDTWLHLDLHRRTVSTALIFEHNAVMDYLGFLTNNYTVVRFGPAQPVSRAFCTPMTCVAFTKHVLGIRSGALRPDALFRTLVQDFGSEVINETETPQAGSPQGNTGATPTAP